MTTTEVASASTGVDPVTIEIVTQRLADITAETGETLERVGGTVNTVQMKDYITAIYRRDGALISTAAKLVFHVYCAGRAVHEVIDRRGSSIKPGDMFILNDPYIAAVHQSDMYLVSPIMFDDELVGWSATFVHVMDIGAQSPGGNSPAAREVEHEGLRFGALRIVEDGVLRTDIVDLLAGMTRQPEMVGLDLRSQVAANFTARDRVVQLYERYGTELVEAVLDHNIEDGRKILEQRLAEIPDNTFEETLVLPISAHETAVFACTLTKRGSAIEFDFSRCSPQASIGVNLPVHSTFGACAEAIFKTIARDLHKSEGLFKPIVMTTAPGSVVSVEYPAPVSLNTTSGGAAARFLVHSLVSRLLATSERWRDAASTRSLGHRIARHAARSQYDSYYVSALNPVNGGGSRLDRDGTDCSSDTATHNVEWMEEHFPLLQLYRRYRLDGGGAGRARGGIGEESAYVLHHAPDGVIRIVSFGTLGALGGHGMFGGHPGAAGELMVYKEQDLGQPRSTANIQLDGPPLTPMYDDLLVEPDDVLVLRSSSGPGSGDPLLRSPDEVLRDVRMRRLSAHDAEHRYGVVLAGATVDMRGTESARESLRAARHQAALATGWVEEDASGIDKGCEPAVGRCAQALSTTAAGLPVVRRRVGELGWTWAAGYPEPSVDETFCPQCWSLVDCQIV